MAIVNAEPNSGWIHDVVDEIATRTGRDATDLPPLSQAVDVDALAVLVGEARSDTFSVTFEYYGNVVEVDGSGSVEVEPEAAPSGRRPHE